MSKKEITIIASEETFQNLSTFDDINDLNNTIRQYKSIHKLNKNTVRILDLLHRYSAKHKGVSFLTKNNIAKSLEISRMTVIRACQKLESLGIVKQYEMKRKSDMQQTSNAIVIQPIEEFVTQDKHNFETNCDTNKTTSLSLKQKINNKRKSIQYNKEFVSSNIPIEFIDTVSPFFTQTEDIYHLWSKLTLACRKGGSNGLISTHIDIFIKVFKESIYRLKKNRIKGSFFGYLYKSWERTAYELDLKMNSRKGIYYDWLDSDC